MIIAKALGMFGPIWVVDSPQTRFLTIGSQIQGECFLQPAGPEGLVPGPVAASKYMAGWLLAGAMNPQGHGLMLGLGSGCGAVAILNSCPGVSLTVVEIDPAIVSTAVATFPLLDYYQDQGRLQIVTSDATAYVWGSQDRWQFGLMDAYQGKNDAHCPEDLLWGMADHCDHLWLNCIDTPGGPKVQAVSELLATAGKPIVWAKPIGHVPTAQQNVILSTQAIDPGQLASFVPYPDCGDDVNVLAARKAVQLLAS